MFKLFTTDKDLISLQDLFEIFACCPSSIIDILCAKLSIDVFPLILQLLLCQLQVLGERVPIGIQ